MRVELEGIRFEDYARGYKDGYEEAMTKIEHELKHMHNMVPYLRYGLCHHNYQLTGPETAKCSKCGAKTSAR